MKSILLLSGGMDSAVCAGIARSKPGRLTAVHFLYGQRTEVKEIECFHHLTNHYGIENKIQIQLPFFKDYTKSSLTDRNIKVPENQLDPDTVPNTYVPFRNGVFLSYALAVAEEEKADRIYIGAVEEDSSGYPDCREEFYRHMNKAARAGTTLEKIELITPLIHKTKREIVRLGMDLEVPFQYTWSCYQNSKEACGVCDSCLLRLKAFQEAGISDPIPYKKDQ